MRLVVTGGGGFLGFHLARGLADAESVLLLDAAEFPDEQRPDNCTTVVADIRDRAALKEAFASADAVVHAAAALPLWKPAEIHDVNVNGTRAVLEEARAAGVGRVVHVSSTAVYGIPDHHPLHEQDPMEGVGPYGESKVGSERVCEEARAAGMCVPVVRPKTFIGPERLGVFQILFDWVREGRKIPVIGNGRNRYQLLDVEDLVAAAALLLERPEPEVNATFNVGAVEFSTVADDLGALFAHAGTGSRILPTNARLAKGTLAVLEAMRLSPLYKWVYGTADQDSWVATDRIQAIGWHPLHSNAATLIRTYDWYLANRHLLSGPGKGHRVPWREGALAIVRRFL